MSPTIEVDGLSVVYRAWGSRAAHALDGVGFRAQAGEIVGVLGPNGSGKSTLLAVLAGSLPPSAGTARVLGRPSGDPALLRAVGFQPEGPLPFRDATPRAFLHRFVDLIGLPGRAGRAAADALLARLGLGPVATQRTVRRLSTGMARRLGLAAALLPEPRVLLVDEPTAGLDPEGSLLVMDMLREVARAGGTVLMASHHLQEVEELCARVLVLEGGRKVAEGSLDALLGTNETQLTLAGLDAAGLLAVRQAAEAAGGTVVACGPRRQHLFALFRRLQGRP